MAVGASSDTRAHAAELERVLELLERARAQYARAVQDGRVKEPLEYHESRGLYLIALRIFGRIADDLRERNDDAVAAITAELDRLAATWPALELVPAPSASPQEVAAAVTRVGLAAITLRAPG